MSAQTCEKWHRNASKSKPRKGIRLSSFEEGWFRAASL